MPGFVIDSCTDTAGQKQYLALFFKDLFKLNGFHIIVGGSKMNREFQKKPELLKIIQNLKSIGRVRALCASEVDTVSDEIEARCKEVMGKIPNSCDDFHILAVCRVSGCINVITKEKRLSQCIALIRPRLGHDICPQFRIIGSEKVYTELKRRNAL